MAFSCLSPEKRQDRPKSPKSGWFAGGRPGILTPCRRTRSTPHQPGAASGLPSLPPSLGVPFLAALQRRGMSITSSPGPPVAPPSTRRTCVVSATRTTRPVPNNRVTGGHSGANEGAMLLCLSNLQRPYGFPQREIDPSYFSVSGAVATIQQQPHGRSQERAPGRASVRFCGVLQLHRYDGFIRLPCRHRLPECPSAIVLKAKPID